MGRWNRFARRKAELDEELEAHRQMAIADRVAKGESEQHAREETDRELGNVALAKDVTREIWGWVWLEHLGRDVTYAFRQMRRNPGFAVVVIGTLALGIGAATAMFTVVDHVLLQPVSFKDTGRLVKIDEAGKTGNPFGSSTPWPDIQEWKARSRSFEGMGFSGEMHGRSYFEGGAAALPVRGIRVSSGLFPLLGVSPWLGHGFDTSSWYAADKDVNAVILSYPVWQAAFGDDRNVIGQVIHLSGAAYTVVGVMPRGFSFPVDNSSSVKQIWTPVQLGPEDEKRTEESLGFDEVIGRLKRGVTVAAARTEMIELQRSIVAEYSDAVLREGHSRVFVRELTSSLANERLSKALLALLTAAGVLWLIASVNATNLLLARGMARQREIAMRGALGAGRWRVMQQMMIEGLVLSAGAALAGIGLAILGIRLVGSALPIHLGVNLSTHLNFAILAALCVLTVTTAVIVASWPAWISARTPIEPALRQGGQQAGTGRRQRQVRGVLVSVEIALSLTLLVACGLLLRTIFALRHVPLGYRTDHILVANLNLPAYRYQEKNIIEVLYKPLLSRVQLQHGVEAAGMMTEVPLGRTFTTMVDLEMNGKEITANLKMVSPDIQKIFGFKMLAGRFYNRDDSPTSPPVIVVNPAFVREYAPDKHDPASVLGMSFWRQRKNAPMHIVGVMGDERQTSVVIPSQPEVDICLCQLAPGTSGYEMSTTAMDLAVRTQRPTKEMIPELRAILKQVAPELGIANITTMEQVVEDSYGSQRLTAHLLGAFGGTALLLSVAGLYGLLAYVVNQRTREMGVRIALGSPRGKLLWLILYQAGAMLLAGLAVGAGLAWSTARLVRGFLYGVKPHDGWTLLGAILTLLVSGLIAAYIPASRAASVNPIDALRSE